MLDIRQEKMEFNNLLKLIRRLNKSVLFIAHEKEEKNGEDKIIRPDVPGSSGADLIKDLDFVGYMEAKRNQTHNFIFSNRKILCQKFSSA